MTDEIRRTRPSRAHGLFSAVFMATPLLAAQVLAKTGTMLPPVGVACPNNTNSPRSYIDPANVGTAKVMAGITPGHRRPGSSMSR